MNKHLSNLLKPIKLGDLELPNRIVMAPMTRKRVTKGNVPTKINATYYAQRASAGLIISEATQISQQGTGTIATPGIYTPEQIAGWQLVTKAVHNCGGRIFLQLWHVGRYSHPSLQAQGKLPVAPSAIAPQIDNQIMTPIGLQNVVTPRELLSEEIPNIIQQYREGSKNAQRAGFDGVEIHSANGYLLDQFLQDNTNHRTDHYGGSIQNRTRLLMEVTEAVTEVWGGNRVGVRLSPSSTYGDMHDSNPTLLFNHVVTELNKFELAYVHIIEPRIKGSQDDPDEPKVELGVRYFRPMYKGKLITAGGYTYDTGEAILANDMADFVAYGRLFIANPDLPQRFALNAPLNQYYRDTFTQGDHHGYIDYPFLD
ncbi:alkene reductase [Crocosphaera sp. XPORK-15E]|uniref:alkene reductase n=1 Tax=Crocosphaera sp. XPORK-15E TaxID=3110247 RepID=UPI002B20795E|nr:alkene reductase [Crocosphaera sp. XPORK-15E]MEA5536962.1 alkene reductase [Crocosphaera sp. XPORK-15E]